MSNIVFTVHLHISDETAIENFIGKMEDVLKQCGGSISIGQKEAAFKKREHSFFEFAWKEIKQLELEERYSTSRNHATAIRSFSRFREGKDITISEISSEIMVTYETWLKRKGVCLNTISCYMRSLSAIYNKGVVQGLSVQQSTFCRVFTGLEKTVKRAVTVEDVQALLKLQLPTRNSMAWARDLFVFSFYARGMPFVDMAYLKKQQIHDGYLVYHRRKTQQEIRVKLEPCMLEIIDKYHCEDTEFVFPILSQAGEKEIYQQYREKLSYYNKLLKQLSAQLRKECQLTSYVARHTWASVAYSSEIGLPVISQALGHNTPTTTLVYVKELGTNMIDEANSKLISMILRNKKNPTSI